MTVSTTVVAFSTYATWGIRHAVREAATGFDTEAQMIDGERRAVLARAVAGLAPRERDILRQHFGLAGRPERSLTEIGVGLGMSRERVRQIERGALDRLAERPELRLVHAAA